jgi:Sulfotransferase domain
MRVINVGYLRTGTTTLTLALEQLGFGPCYHMRVVEAEPWRAADWVAAARDRNSAHWDKVFAGYETTVGDPGALFWRELVEAFPDAKVILSVRDPLRWYESASRTIFPALTPPSLPVRLLTWSGPKKDHADLDEVQRMTWDVEFDGRLADRDHAIEVFERRIREVRETVPADRLLVYDVREGWGPLCSFLGVPEPDEPMPRENDRETFQRRQRDALKRLITSRVRTLATIGVGAALATWAVRRRLRSRP